LFAFGGLYTWTLYPLVLLLAIGIARVRPQLFGRYLIIDVLLIALVAAVAAQIVLLPPSLANAISPQSASVVDTLRFAADGDDGAWRALSIGPGATRTALVCLMLAVAAFWLARATFEGGRLGSIVRPCAWAGLVISVIAIVQRSTTPLMMYGLWRPADAGARPFGPFVNRNHLATWLLMAIAVTIGHIASHLRGRARHVPAGRVPFAHAVDPAAVWEAGAAIIMLSGLFMSLSRSAMAGLLVGAATGFALTYAKTGRVRTSWVAGSALLLLLIATYLSNFDALADRFARVVEESGRRAEIWRQTMPMIRDFPLVGTGAGTFSRAMLVYQHGDRQVLFNQAHNHYLQVLAEGGALVALPALGAGAMLVILVIQRLKRDTTAAFWVRAGAVAGLVAVAVQSVWEIGLVMPASSVLFAICAALAVHQRG
jgi:O-antigen ligase